MSSGDPKTTLPTESRWAIYQMYVRDRLTYREISRRTHVDVGTVRNICRRPGSLVDTNREVRPTEFQPATMADDIETLMQKVSRLHELVCPEQPLPTLAFDKRKASAK